MISPLELPAPDANASAHSLRVAELLSLRIDEAGGWLPFSRFLDTVLYAPGLGYYSAGSRKFGETGDFVTAPELSPVFARCIAAQIAGTMAELTQPVITELGAGSGAMAVDIMAALDGLGSAPVEYRILELSGDLKARQQAMVAERLPELMPRFRWLDRIAEEPREGVILGNEVLDALPFDRFRSGENGLVETGVINTRVGFSLDDRPAREPIVHQLGDMLRKAGLELAPGFAGELRADLDSWLMAVTENLARGLVLFVDYGLPRRELYHPDRSGQNLSCFYRHRVHGDVLFMPGLQDITAWVDFTHVAEAAEAAGLEVAGYTTQAGFLLAAGLSGQHHLSGTGQTREGVSTAAALGTLLLPGEMGERFKLMALTRNVEPPPAFAGHDDRHRL